MDRYDKAYMQRMNALGSGRNDHELVVDKDGMLSYQLPEPTSPQPTLESEGMNPFALPPDVPEEGMGPIEYGKNLGATAGGMTTGAAAVTAGSPFDLAGIIKGGIDAMGAEEGEQFATFLETLGNYSETLGSEFFLGKINERLDQLPINDELKETWRGASKYVGEMAGLPLGLKGLSSGIRSYIRGAPERVAEREGGTMLRSGMDPREPIDNAIVGTQNMLRGPAGQTDNFYVNVRENPEFRQQARSQVQQIAENKGNAQITKDDIADFYEQQHANIYGRKLDPTNDEDFAQAVDAAAEEISYQLGTGTSGRGWYDDDVMKTWETLSQVPGLEPLAYNEDLRVLWSALAGPTSNGNKVTQNAKIATAALRQYMRTGEIPTSPPEAGQIAEGISGAGWGPKQQTVAKGLQVINYLVQTKGLEGFADWWLSPHTLGELTEVRKAAGLSGPPSNVTGGRNSMHLGAYVTGGKTGPFSLNINGYEGTTKDVWFTRSYGRHFGQLRNEAGKLIEAPRNQAEQNRMNEFVRGIINRLEDQGLSEQDAQAVLWFYEQNLFTDLGLPSRPGAFSEGAEAIANELRPGIRGGDEVEAAAEQTAEGLTGVRGVSPGQRAVRSQRRESAAGAGDLGDFEGSPGPYTRGSVEGDEGNGLLEFVPEPSEVQRYESAGLSLPTIRQVDATENASQYNADMVEAMSNHEFGAQVEIKSPEELANASLFRTDNGSGFAIKPDGDIVAVFASQSEPSGGAYGMLQAAVQAGGVKLDAFDTFLPKIYKTVGFRPVARVAWNDEYAPPNWDKETFAKYNNGEPDVVLFVYDPNYFGEAVEVPRFDDFDEAARIQDQEVQRLAQGNTPDMGADQ